jgi:hypothetical protein
MTRDLKEPIRPDFPDPKALKRLMWTDFVRWPDLEDGARQYANSRYHVTRRKKTVRIFGVCMEIEVLGVMNYDNSAWHDWRDFQRIKDSICGREALAIEVYPPAANVVDPSNFFLLWVLPPGSFECIGLGPGRILSPGQSIAPQRDPAVSAF